MKNFHLAILKKPYLDAILDGAKTIESRLTVTKRSPFNRISLADMIFFKISSGPVCAAASVAAVKQFENLDPQQIIEIKQKYNHQIRGTDRYWLKKANSRFALLVWLKNVHPIEPVYINKKDWRAWVVLDSDNNFGLFENPAIKPHPHPSIPVKRQFRPERSRK